MLKIKDIVGTKLFNHLKMCTSVILFKLFMFYVKTFFKMFKNSDKSTTKFQLKVWLNIFF